MGKEPAKVISLVDRRGNTSLTDIAGNLRRMADDIESGALDVRSVAVAVECAQTMERAYAAFAWGEFIDNYKTAGLFQAGIQEVLRVGAA